MLPTLRDLLARRGAEPRALPGRPMLNSPMGGDDSQYGALGEAGAENAWAWDETAQPPAPPTEPAWPTSPTPPDRPNAMPVLIGIIVVLIVVGALVVGAVVFAGDRPNPAVAESTSSSAESAGPPASAGSPATAGAPPTGTDGSGGATDGAASSSQDAPEPSSDSRVPVSGTYTGTGEQRALASDVRDRSYLVEMTYSGAGSTIRYPDLDCAGVLLPEGLYGDSRVYVETITDGGCDNNGTWTVTVTGDRELTATYSPPSGRYVVVAELTR